MGHENDIHDFMNWCVEQIMETYGMERKDIIAVIEDWLERNW